MRTPRIGCYLLILVALLLSRPATAQEPVDLGSLLHEMVDRARLAQVPSPHFLCRQFSSYDRDTVREGEKGWYANWDRSQFVRVEERNGRKEHVMLDVDGPGAIVRIWSTWHGPRRDGERQPFSNGTLRFYLDGQAEPAIEGPIAELISGGRLVGAPFSESVSPQSDYRRRGHNLYLPIPYQAGCRITYESDAITDVGAKNGEALYYQINYRAYAPGTKVRSFAGAQLAEFAAVIEAVGQELLASSLGDTAQAARARIVLSPRSGAEELLAMKDGPLAICGIRLRLEAEDREQALRSTILEAEFDGERTIWCPVGDFFGTGYMVHPYRSWFTEVQEDGTMICRWVMPCAQTARLRLLNLGDQEVQADAEIWRERHDWNERSMHFHATWSQLTGIDTGPDKDMTGKGAFDVNYVTIEGEGQVVGDTLTLFNGTNAWWGEGDEKIYIDGEAFPSHVGTGTEDYYGYAWCRPEAFHTPFHAQPCGDGNLAGGFAVNSRYRLLDALPFTGAIRFDMELWHWKGTKMNYAPTVFWYARPGARCNVEPDPESARLPVARERSDVVPVRKVPGAIEGETLKILEKTGGKTEVQSVDRFAWSGNAQLWWIDGKPGDRLALALPVKETGRYRVIAALTKAADYGIVRFALAGKAGKPLDRYAESVAHDAIVLGTFELAAGISKLEIEIVGANPDAIPRHMFGLDYVKLEKVE